MCQRNISNVRLCMSMQHQHVGITLNSVFGIAADVTKRLWMGHYACAKTHERSFIDRHSLGVTMMEKKKENLLLKDDLKMRQRRMSGTLQWWFSRKLPKPRMISHGQAQIKHQFDAKSI